MARKLAGKGGLLLKSGVRWGKEELRRAVNRTGAGMGLSGKGRPQICFCLCLPERKWGAGLTKKSIFQQKKKKNLGETKTKKDKKMGRWKTNGKKTATVCKSLRQTRVNWGGKRSQRCQDCDNQGIGAARRRGSQLLAGLDEDCGRDHGGGGFIRRM